MSSPFYGIIDNEDRKAFDANFRAIAQRMHDKGTWRNPWAVEIDGCVYKFAVKGYAKRGSKVWEAQQKALAQALRDTTSAE